MSGPVSRPTVEESSSNEQLVESHDSQNEDVRTSREVAAGLNDINLSNLDVSIEELPHVAERAVDTARTVLELNTESVRFFVKNDRCPSISNSDIGFINQANTTLVECRAQAVQIFSVTHSPIDTIYNSSLTGWSSRNVSATDHRVLLLRASWNDFFSMNRQTGLYRLQLCAGDSIFLVRRALEDYRYRHRIIVVAIAASGSIPYGLCYAVRYYCSFIDAFSHRTNEWAPEEEAFVVRSHPDARQVFDQGFHSSSFLNIIYMEASCFRLRQRLIRSSAGIPANFDMVLQNLRRRYTDFWAGEDWISWTDMESRRRQLLEEFFSEFGAMCPRFSLLDLYEISLDEYPINPLERIMSGLNFSREALMMMMVLIGLMNRSSTWVSTVGLVFLGMTELTDVSVFVLRLGPYLSRRRQENFSLLRRHRRLAEFCNVIGFLFNCMQWEALLTSGLPRFFIRGIGSYVFLRGTHILVENIFTFCRPIRTRIQIIYLGREEVGDIQTPPYFNHQATQMGLVQGVIRAAIEIGVGLGTVAVAGMLIYPVLFSPPDWHPTTFRREIGSELDISNMTDGLRNIGNQSRPITVLTNIAPEGSISDWNNMLEICLFGVTGFLSAASVIANILQIRSLTKAIRYRRARREQEDMIPLQDISAVGERNSSVQQEEEEEVFVLCLEQAYSDDSFLYGDGTDSTNLDYSEGADYGEDDVNEQFFLCYEDETAM